MIFDNLGKDPHVIIKPDGSTIWCNNRKEALEVRHQAGYQSGYKLYHEEDPRLYDELNIFASSGDSPQEKRFSFYFEKEFGYPPDPQIEIGPYRVDFLLWDSIVVEIDGHDFHSSREDRARDAKRDRYLQTNGYKVFRFTGSEVHNDAESCVKELLPIKPC